jgi:predicted RNA-binding protein with TRAM domain
MDGVTYRAFSPAQTSSPVTITTLTDGTTALTNGTSYTVYLKATNAIGTGPASASVTAAPATAPGAPTIGTPTAGDGSVSLTFTAPGSNGGTAITNYSYSTDGTIYTAFSPAQTTSPLTISGLTNAVSYTVRIKAINAAGSSVASSASASFTPATAPGAPTIGTPTAGGGSVSLTFTAPGSNGGSAITNYSYSTDGTTYTALSPAQTTSPLTISGLTNGVTYTIRIKAINSAGSGTASSASASFTPAFPDLFSATGTYTTLLANGRKYYRFTGPGTVVVGAAAASVEYFAVGGGGGGGGGSGDLGGGGGAGGLQTNSSTYATGSQFVSISQLTAGATYTVTIGDGGNVGSGTNGNPYIVGAVGQNTTFTGTGISISATGGGGGKGSGGGGFQNAKAGGCGGGGGPQDGLSFLGIGSQGFNGFNVTPGGGGGIGASATSATGGVGLTYPTGGSTYGAGGTSGGGTTASANTGNGGGGANANGQGGYGGSGIFIISYPF